MKESRSFVARAIRVGRGHAEVLFGNVSGDDREIRRICSSGIGNARYIRTRPRKERGLHQQNEPRI